MNATGTTVHLVRMRILTCTTSNIHIWGCYSSWVEHEWSFCVSSSFWIIYTTFAKLSSTTLVVWLIHCYSSNICWVLSTMSSTLRTHAAVWSWASHQAKCSLWASSCLFISLSRSGFLIALVLHSFLEAHACLAHSCLLTITSILRLRKWSTWWSIPHMTLWILAQMSWMTTIVCHYLLSGLAWLLSNAHVMFVLIDSCAVWLPIHGCMIPGIFNLSVNHLFINSSSAGLLSHYLLLDMLR